MQRAKQPSTPTQELADRRGWTGPTLADGVLTADLAAFCQSGLSVVMASRDSAGRPVVARGLACRLDARGRIRVIYREAANHGFQRAIAAGAQIAAVFQRADTADIGDDACEHGGYSGLLPSPIAKARATIKA